MIKVWFNHWFSTSYGLIELLKRNDNEEVYVIGSNRQVNSVIQKVCDEWYEEPRLTGEEYINYCVNFCVEHNVDVFIPRANMVEVSQNRDRFEKIGIKVLVDDYEKMAVLNNKADAYKLLSEIKNINIPDYEVVKSVDEFENAYKRLKGKHEQICVKFVNDEGAMSYRKIVDEIEPYNRLHMYAGTEVEYSDYLNTLKSIDVFDELMIMPYLPGTEVSVDCLKTEDGIIAIPRYKSPSRHEEVIYDKEILDMTHNILNAIGLEYPCNVQYRFENDIPYLLEINTRMSGGLQMSCLAADINIPDIALNKLLGNKVAWSMEQRECIVSYIETPQIIK